MTPCLLPDHRMRPFYRKAALYLVCLCCGPVIESFGFEIPNLEFEPRQYVCTRTTGPLTIDGKLDEQAWKFAARTTEFVDIEGPIQPAPAYPTSVRMLWDDNYFYIAAQMEEPHVWGTLEERDSVIYHDNDFEVFIDPDGDNHL